MGSADDLQACLLGRFAGPAAPDWLLRWLDDGLGAVLLFAGNITGPAQLAGLVATLREHNPDVLIAVDEEGGIVTRLEAATGSSFPGNAALGAVGDTGLTRRNAAAIGAMLAAAGISLDLAPVADVDASPASPIGVRSFGADPQLVAAHTAAFVTGLHAAGVAACAKHFPGHGRAAEDSHHELPDVPATLAQLRAGDLIPFAAAIGAGADVVMPAHVRYPAVDSLPATVSKRWLQEILRGELGFGGVILTDALEMKAIGDGDDRADGAVAAFAAGADLLLLPGSEQAQRKARAQLTAALEAGVIPARRVSESAQRVRGLGHRTRPPVPGSAADTALGAQAAARALAVEGLAGPLPAPPYVVDAGGVMSSLLEPSAASLLGVLRDRLPGTDGIRVSAPPGGGDSQTDEVIRAALAAAAGRPLVVAVADAHRKPWQARLLAGLLAGRPDVITVGTASTHDRALAGPAYIGTRGASRVSLAAAAQLLASGRPC